MKPLLLGIFISFISVSLATAQTFPDGSIAPDFTVTDINGVSHNLYDDLNAGYRVIVDFCATWCGPCRAQKDNGYFEGLMDTYGPAGDNTLRVYFIESDPNTPESDLAPFIPGANYYIINDPASDLEETIHSMYLNPETPARFYPSTYLICPCDKTTSNISGNFTDINSLCPPASNNGSISLLEKGIVECNGLITPPTFLLRNSGDTDLTSATIDLRFNEALIESLNWTGLLLACDTISAPLNFAPFLSASEDGLLEAEIQTVNNVPDENPAEDTALQMLDMPYAALASSTLTLNILTDSWPEETYWALQDEFNNIVLEGGNTNLTLESGGSGTPTEPFGSNTYQGESEISVNLNTPGSLTGCHTFTIIDAYGDGIEGDGVTPPGNFQLIDSATGEVLLDNSDFEIQKSLKLNFPGLCFQSTIISCGQTLSGNTQNIPSQNYTTCNGTQNLQGVWYQFSSDGAAFELTTCSPNTNFDTELHLFKYQESCDNLQCIASSNSNDGSCGISNQAEIYLPAGDPGNYFVWLTAEGGSAPGNYDLTLICCPSTNVSVSADAALYCDGQDMVLTFTGQTNTTINYLVGTSSYSIVLDGFGTNSATVSFAIGSSTVQLVDVSNSLCTVDLSQMPPLELVGQICNCSSLTDCGGIQYGSVIYVDVDAAGANNGSTWADAFVGLQDAMDVASLPCAGTTEIWVAEGTYASNSCLSESEENRHFVVQGVSLQIYGGFEGTESTITERNECFDPASTILSPILPGDNAGILVTLNLSSGFIMDGFTFSGGSKSVIGVQNQAIGANTLSSPIFQNCVFSTELNPTFDVASDGATIGSKYLNCQFLNSTAGIIGLITGESDPNTAINTVFENCIINNVSRPIVMVLDFGTGTSIFNNCTIIDSDVVFNFTGDAYSVYLNNCVLHDMDQMIQSSGGTNDVILESCWVNQPDCATININEPNINVTCNNVIFDSNSEFEDIFTSRENLRPNSSSPLLNAGDNSFSNESTDIEGKMRIQGTSIDIGAYEGSEIPEEDCNNASNPQVLACGDFVEGNTTNQDPFNAPNCLSNINEDYYAHWYQYIGDGNFIYASVCNSSLDFSPAVYIYTGELNDLQCIGITYESCDAFAGPGVYRSDSYTVPGQNYYIMVGGFQATDFGSFELSIDCQILDRDLDGIVDDEDLCPNNSDTALHFDSNTGNEGDPEADLVLLPVHASNDALANGNISMAAWIYPTDNNGAGTLVSCPTLNWSRNNQKMQLNFKTSSGAAYVVNSTLEIPNFEWNHIAFTIEAINSTDYSVSYFLNGVLDQQQTLSIGAGDGLRSFNGQPWYLGASVDPGFLNRDFYDGKLDALSIWKRTLCPAKPLHLMSGIIDKSDADLLHFFDFNDGPACGVLSNMSLSHHSSSSLNGTLQNFGNSNTVECRSNWTSSSNTDTDNDGFADGCVSGVDSDFIDDCEDLCPNRSDVALDFRKTGNSDYVVVYDINDEIHITDGDFAFQAWVNLHSAGNNTIVSKGHGGNSLTEYIFQIQPDGRLGLFLGNGSVANWQYSLGTIPINEWHNVAVSVNTSTNVPTYRFFIDGVLDASGSFISSLTQPLYDTDEDLYIGRQGSACSCNFFDGIMDDLSIWTRELGAAEFALTMAGSLQGNENGLFAYYRFNDGPPCFDIGANTLRDEGPNGINGTLLNFFGLGGGFCNSDWIFGRNIDSDGDGIGDGCDTVNLPCPAILDAYSISSTSLCNGENMIVSLTGTPGAEVRFQFGSQAIETVSLDANGNYSNVSVSFVPLSSIFQVIDIASSGCTTDLSSEAPISFTINPVPGNSVCSGAIPIDCDETVIANTICGVGQNHELIYRFIGDGSTVTASLCSQVTDFDSSLEVKSGFCGNLNLVVASDNGCGDLNAEVSFTTTPGINYYIEVEGSTSSDNGNFELSVACENDCPPNYSSANALGGLLNADTNYTTSGDIESTQEIESGTTVNYNAGTEVNMFEGFSVKSGAVFHVYIDGCDQQ